MKMTMEQEFEAKTLLERELKETIEPVIKRFESKFETRIDYIEVRLIGEKFGFISYIRKKD